MTNSINEKDLELIDKMCELKQIISSIPAQKALQFLAEKIEEKKIISALVREQELLQILSCSRSTLWRLRRNGSFPKPIKIGNRSIAWIREDIDAWIKERQLKDTMEY